MRRFSYWYRCSHNTIAKLFWYFVMCHPYEVGVAWIWKMRILILSFLWVVSFRSFWFFFELWKFDGMSRTYTKIDASLPSSSNTSLTVDSLCLLFGSKLLYGWWFERFHVRQMQSRYMTIFRAISTNDLLYMVRKWAEKLETYDIYQG